MVDMHDTLSPQMAVIGSMLIDEKVIGGVLARTTAEDFLSPRYRMLYQAIKAQFTSGEPVDPVTVRTRLGGCDGDNWTSLMMQTMELTPTANNVWVYIDELKAQARTAKIQSLGRQIYETTNPEEQRECLARLNALQVDRPGVRSMTMAQAVQSFYERQNAEHEYLDWGLPKLNERMYAELGDLIVLGGYPSAGKTALALNFAWTLSQRYRIGFYSLETNRYKLTDRLLSDLFDIGMGDIKRGTIDEDGWKRAAERSAAVINRPIEVVEASGWTVDDIHAHALANRHQVIFVDYLQLIRPGKSYNRTEQVSQISMDLHTMAQSSGITVVALSQLSRAVTVNKKGQQVELAPTMASLRESGQIEQDADAVLLLYLEEPNKPDDSRRVLQVAKNKEGRRGKTYLSFDGQHQRFRESVIDGPAPGAGDIQRQLCDAGNRIKAKNHADALAAQQMTIKSDDGDMPF